MQAIQAQRLRKRRSWKVQDRNYTLPGDWSGHHYPWLSYTGDRSNRLIEKVQKYFCLEFDCRKRLNAVVLVVNQRQKLGARFLLVTEAA
jgi:hypothetical protein